MLSLEDVRALHQVLGLVVVVPRPDGSLPVEGATPGWLRRLGGGELSDPAHAVAPFLEVVLPDARAFWAERRGGRLRSGLFTVPDSQQDVHFEISALTLNARDVLILECWNDHYSETQEVYQKAREGFLLFKKSLETQSSLTAAKAEVEAAGEAAAATLANWCEDMRRPANAVTAAVDVLAEHELNQAERDMVEVIRRNIQTLLGLIENAIDFAKAQRG
jgi:signal transduction histidine kinase